MAEFVAEYGWPWYCDIGPHKGLYCLTGALYLTQEEWSGLTGTLHLTVTKPDQEEPRSSRDPE